VTATEVFPQPRAAVGAVFVDNAARALSVRPGDTESGYVKTLWRAGWTALRDAQERGWPLDGPPLVYADAPGTARRTILGRAGDGGTLTFAWPIGTAGYSELVGKPLSAIVTMDVNTHRILSCRFLDRAGS
jgi:hypothetical protein